VLSNDRPGGTQAVTLGHAQSLAGSGLGQTVIFCSRPSKESGLRASLEAEAVHVRYLPLEDGRLRFALRFWRLCRRQRITAVMSHGLGFHLMISVAARAAGVRRVIVMVGNPVAPDQVDIGVLRRRSRIASPLVHAVIACSDHVGTTLVQNVGLRPDVVRSLANPLDVIDIGRRAQATRAARHNRKLPVICTVARLDPIKDHETVIRAGAVLRTRGRPFVLKIVGTGPTEPRLRLLVDELGLVESVAFIGERSDIPEILGAADVFAFGMTWDEGFGVAVAEAMSARTPIVCTDAGPASEVLDEGRAGLLVPAGDAVAMADAIERLLDDADARAMLVEVAAAVATQRHDPSRLSRELEEVLGL
jgi:glycosyltransferase involved in cell wall biosynthesis